MRFPALRVLLAGGLALAGVLSLSIPSQSVSVCQKKNRIKLRAEGCKAKETELGAVALDVDPVPGPQPGADLTGIWRAIERVSGDSQLTSSRERVEFLILRADGTGTIHQSNPGSGLIACSEFVYTRGGDLVVDRSGDGGDAVVWNHELDGDVLALSDATRASATFERSAAVDADLDCAPLNEERRVEALPAPRFSTGLAFDGSLLYYLADDRLVRPIAAFGGDQLAPIDLGTFDTVHAYGGASLWGDCSCGGTPEAVRTSFDGTVLNDVNVEDLLGTDFSVDAIASDLSTGRIWVSGENRLVEIDGNTSGGAVLSNRPFEQSLRAMAFDGTDIWILSRGGAIGRLDLTTLRVAESFRSPEPTVELLGIAVSGFELHLLGRRNQTGTILSVTAP